MNVHFTKIVQMYIYVDLIHNDRALFNNPKNKASNIVENSRPTSKSRKVNLTTMVQLAIIFNIAKFSMQWNISSSCAIFALLITINFITTVSVHV